MNKLFPLRNNPNLERVENSLLFTKTRELKKTTIFSTPENRDTKSFTSESQYLQNQPKTNKPNKSASLSKRKENWYHDEDIQLLALIAQLGPRNWSKIASHFPNRQGKQCRERWHNHLNPHINKHKWTYKEERVLLQAYLKYSSKWAIIARYLPGRTDNCIKNHFNSTIKRKLRMKELSTDMTPLADQHRLTVTGTDDSEPETQSIHQSFTEQKMQFESPRFGFPFTQVFDNISESCSSQIISVSIPVFDPRGFRTPVFLDTFLAKIGVFEDNFARSEDFIC